MDTLELQGLAGGAALLLGRARLAALFLDTSRRSGWNEIDAVEPLAVTQLALAEHIGVPVQRVNEIVRGKRGISRRLGSRTEGFQDRWSRDS